MGHWLMDTAGIGSIIVFTVGFAVLAAYVSTLRWIQTAPRDPDPAEAAPEGEEIIAAETGGKEG